MPNAGPNGQTQPQHTNGAFSIERPRASRARGAGGGGGALRRSAHRQGPGVGAFFLLLSPGPWSFSLGCWTRAKGGPFVFVVKKKKRPNPHPHGRTRPPDKADHPEGGWVDWAGGLPRGRGGVGSPSASGCCRGGGLGRRRGVPCSSRRVADGRSVCDAPGPGRQLIAREREPQRCEL